MHNPLKSDFHPLLFFSKINFGCSHLLLCKNLTILHIKKNKNTNNKKNFNINLA